MLIELFIENFTIIKKSQISFQHNMTVLTGETGAGKSILLDALGLLMGNRANPNLIRSGAKQADISAIFDIIDQPIIQQYLHSQSLSDEQLILRRIITTDGRSKAFINGKPATLQQLKTLSPWLAHVHGQHDHHALLQPQHQLAKLDSFANHPELLTETANAYHTYQEAMSKLDAARTEINDNEAQHALLQYQVAELDQLNLTEHEYQSLYQEHQQLNHAQDLLSGSQQLLESIKESQQHALLDQLGQYQKQLDTLVEFDPTLSDAKQLMNEAQIALEEAYNSLKQYQQTIETNPEQQLLVEQRLTQCVELSRKHQIAVEYLHEHHQSLKQALQQLGLSIDHLPELENHCDDAKQHYQQAAMQLHKSRLQAAKNLSTAVTQYLKQLGFKYGQFKIEIEYDADTTQQLGGDHIQFKVQTNQGQPMQAMQKIVSGGELSRLSLAIQMLTAEKQSTPTLIFDEVDTGVGGSIAEIIGQLLNKLGQHCQVLCVTHLAQIASQAQQHLHIDKIQTETETESFVTMLDGTARIQEIARMIGGIKLTEQTLAYAQEMLEPIEITEDSK